MQHPPAHIIEHASVLPSTTPEGGQTLVPTHDVFGHDYMDQDVPLPHPTISGNVQVNSDGAVAPLSDDDTDDAQVMSHVEALRQEVQELRRTMEQGDREVAALRQQTEYQALLLLETRQLNESLQERYRQLQQRDLTRYNDVQELVREVQDVRTTVIHLLRDRSSGQQLQGTHIYDT